jgi:hypothetical protein
MFDCIQVPSKGRFDCIQVPSKGRFDCIQVPSKGRFDWIGLKQMFDPNIFVLIASNKIDRQMKVHTT